MILVHGTLCYGPVVAHLYNDKSTLVSTEVYYTKTAAQRWCFSGAASPTSEALSHFTYEPVDRKIPGRPVAKR